MDATNQIMPRDVDDDWFDELPTVRRRTHLIDIINPNNVRTVRSNYHQTYDTHGTPFNPKVVVCPWLPSTIQPDSNAKKLTQQ